MRVEMLEEIEGLFSELDRRRGRAYFAEGRVTLEECGPRGVLARVRGSRVYLASLARSGSGWSVMCTCPAFERESTCKHLFATVLAARARRLEVARESRAGRAPRKSARRPAWQRLLEELEGAGALAAEFEEQRLARISVRWVLRVDPAGAEPGLHLLETQLARRRANGSAPAWRAANLRAAQRDELDEEERALVALLWGLRREDYGTWDALEAQTRVPAELQDGLLRPLAAAGRLHLGAFTESEAVPLALDEGPPFALELALENRAQEIGLCARLVRGEERLALDARLVVLEGGLCVAGGRLARVDWRGAWRWIGALRAVEACPIPAAELGRVLDFLATLPAALRIESEFLERVAHEPRGSLRLFFPGGTTAAAPLRAELGFRYAEEVLRPGQRGARVRREAKLLEIARDESRERALEQQFREAGGRLAHDARGEGLVPRALFPALVRALDAAGWTIEAEGKPVRPASEPTIRVASGIDWFDLEAEIEFGPVRASLPELLRALDAREPFVRLADGSRGLLPERWLRSMETLRALGTPEGAGLRVAGNRAWLLEAWLEAQREVDVDAGFARARAHLARLREVTPRAAPAGFRGELRGYQREGLGWLHALSESGLGGCLADDMGLGKTVQVLALLVERRARARGPSLVVAPCSVLFNWQREAQRFAHELNVLLHHGAGRAKRREPLEDADLVLTSYGTLRRDAALFAKLDLDCAVLDEAQAIKNEASLSAKAAGVLHADLRLALTGTPVENHLGELHSIFGFLNPGLVDRALERSGLFERGLDDPETARWLSRALRPFLLRRTKEQVAPELPPRTEQVLACELEGAERRAYDELREHIRRELLGKIDALGLERAGMNVLESLLRLRQAACHPGLLDERRAHESSAKLEALLPLLDEVRESGHKALVFSQFTSFLAILRRRLDAQGVRYEYLDGRTKKREERVRRFQEDADVPLFLISLKAGGTGLNLTAADYVFLMDPWWNPAVEAQAIDRTHRIGQTRAVTAYRLVAQDTVEEKVLALQEKKRALVQALFEGGGRGGGATLRDLTREDLEWILG